MMNRNTSTLKRLRFNEILGKCVRKIFSQGVGFPGLPHENNAVAQYQEFFSTPPWPSLWAMLRFLCVGIGCSTLEYVCLPIGILWTVSRLLLRGQNTPPPRGLGGFRDRWVGWPQMSAFWATSPPPPRAKKWAANHGNWPTPQHPPQPIPVRAMHRKGDTTRAATAYRRGQGDRVALAKGRTERGTLEAKGCYMPPSRKRPRKWTS